MELGPAAAAIQNLHLHHHGAVLGDGSISSDDIAAFDAASAGQVDGTTGLIQSTTTGAALSGLVINASYDSSISDLATSSPSLYSAVTGAITDAIQFFESHISNAITINIDFGFGEVEGMALGGNALGESSSVYGSTVSYHTLLHALQNHATTANDIAAVGTLPANSPVGNSPFAVPDAEAKALGLMAANSAGIDGYVGLSSTAAFTYDPNNPAVSGEFNAISVLEHEISEVMGRTESLGTYTGANFYSPLDLFRYSAPGVRDLTPGPGYFSIDSGQTNLATFNDPTSGGDAADWSSAVPNDAFDAAVGSDSANAVSAVDLIAMNVLGYATACYCAGSLILTARGEIPVEQLRVGDIAVTTGRGGGLKPVIWIGTTTIDLDRHPKPMHVTPVRIRAGAIGSNEPHRDLLVSPEHAIAFRDGDRNPILVPAVYLVNGASILRESPHGKVDYFHVELERHDVLLANGLPAESYLDTGNREAFANAGAHRVLYPDFRPGNWSEDSCAPLLLAEAAAAFHAKLLSRAIANGFAITTDPGLTIRAGAVIVTPIRHGGGTYIFVLPPHTGEVRLLSRAMRPSEINGLYHEERTLGVAVKSLTLDGAAIALDSQRLAQGFWPGESEGGLTWRWTNGAAILILPPCSRRRVFDVTLHEGWPHFWADADPVAASRQVFR